MKSVFDNGVKPLDRSREWKGKERREQKRKKRYNKSSKGGCIAPIFVPATQQGELTVMLKDIAEKEAEVQSC